MGQSVFIIKSGLLSRALQREASESIIGRGRRCETGVDQNETKDEAAYERRRYKLQLIPEGEADRLAIIIRSRFVVCDAKGKRREI